MPNGGDDTPRTVEDVISTPASLYVRHTLPLAQARSAMAKRRWGEGALHAAPFTQGRRQAVHLTHLALPACLPHSFAASCHRSHPFITISNVALREHPFINISNVALREHGVTGPTG